MLALIAVLMLAFGVCGLAADKSANRLPTKETRAKREKARYYYLEGLKHQVEHRPAEAYEYFKHAATVDPTLSAAVSAMGALRLTINVDTLQTRAELLRSMAMLKPFVDEYPREYDEASYYAYVATRLDSLQEARRVFERLDTLMPERTATLLRLADLYFNMKEDDKGFATLERYEKIEGKSPQLTLQKISYLLNRRDTTAALKETTSLIESNPREAGYLILKGNLFYLTGQNDSVFAYLDKAEKLSPGSGSVKMNLADYYLNLGDTTAYDNKIYEALLAEDFGKEEKVGILAGYLQKLLYDKSDTGRGDYLFSVLERQYPHEKDVLDLASRYSAAKGDMKTAIEKVGYAIDMDSADESLWLQKMRYQTSDDDYAGALATYDEACRHIEPSSAMTLSAAYIAQMNEDYSRAISIYESLIKALIPNMQPGQPIDMRRLPSSISLEQLERASSLYASIGDCYHAMKDMPATFQAYDNALLLDPEASMALNNYAYFLLEDQENPAPEVLDRAEEMSRKSLKGDNSENPTYLDTYAWILYKKGNYEEAEIYQKQAIDKSEEQEMESAEIYDHYGDILNALGKKEEAREYWDKAKALDPDLKKN